MISAPFVTNSDLAASPEPVLQLWKKEIYCFWNRTYALNMLYIDK